MKMGTIAGVLGAAAAVVAILVSAPARAATPDSVNYTLDVSGETHAPKAEPAAERSTPEPASWLLILAGVAGLGAMLRAGRDGMTAR